MDTTVFQGRVFSQRLPGGWAEAQVELHGDALQARTGGGETFSLPYRDCRLDLGIGGAVVCRTPDRSLQIACDDPRFLSAAQHGADGRFADEVRRLVESRKRQSRRTLAWRAAGGLLLLALCVGGYYAAKAGLRGVLGTLGVDSIELRGSGTIQSTNYEIVDFDQIRASRTFRVTIRQGDSFDVLVRCDDNVTEHVRVTKEGQTLHLGLDPEQSYSLRDVTLEADVTLPSLAGVRLSGASRATIEQFELDQSLSADLSAGSSLTGNVKAQDVRLHVSGASRVTLSGSSGKLIIDASAGSKLDLATLQVGDAQIEASGASTISVWPSGRLDVDASAASRVLYRGDPTLGQIETSGASTVRRE